MASKMPYRLALDLGSSSLGWAMIRLNAQNEPCAVIKAGVRIFPDGRNPKDGSSLAVTRREARAMRRRRDRLLKRKARMMQALIKHGFFPADSVMRKALETLNPYELRARGLDEALTPEQFGRAMFHINQRRGFKSNRKTDKKENDSGALNAAIRQVNMTLAESASRTVGELLYKRMTDLNKPPQERTVRARYREQRLVKDDGKPRIERRYDLYIDRAMIEAEFDALWAKQAQCNSALFNQSAHDELKDTLLFQRRLKPVKPGRCTFLPDEERAPLAMPSTQRFRMYQEVNNLRILNEGFQEVPLSRDQRDVMIDALERNRTRSFAQLRKLLELPSDTQFNLEDEKRQELKGNATGAILSREEYFGAVWSGMSDAMQDEIVHRLVTEESESKLVLWLQEIGQISEAQAEATANARLPEGFGALSRAALVRILPELRSDMVTYDKAVIAAGFTHHSLLDQASSGEILPELPYYGIVLQRHVGFGTNNPADCNEKRYGKIANPTVHIGLNQVRIVVNALIKRYGHPNEVIVEVARDLKQSNMQRMEDNKRQAENQRRNQRLRQAIASNLQISEEHVKSADIQKMLLWEELGQDGERCCPYSGMPISLGMLFTDEIEVEHILPFSQTLDDSLNNKTVALRSANRVKGNRIPWDAFGKQACADFDYAAILQRAELLPKTKRYRFAEDGYQRWLKDDAGFLARALNDTRYLSRIARDYVSLICPGGTRVIPGQMTALLRGKFGLNDVLGINGEKNRNDHRHHAVDACVIGVTDQRLLQRFAQASASTRDKQLNKLVDSMPLPWSTYRDHVRRAVNSIWVSHKPDHSHEGAMHNDTAYGLRGNGRVGVHKMVDGKRHYFEDNLKVIPMGSLKAGSRHGPTTDGAPPPYKGYKGDSNYCMEICRDDKGRWEADVISTFDAYQIARKLGKSRLRDPGLSRSGKPLVMRLMIDDVVRLEMEGALRTMRVASLKSNGQLLLSDIHEANVAARTRNKEDPLSYVTKMVGSLQKAKARHITISPIGEIRDGGGE